MDQPAHSPETHARPERSEKRPARDEIVELAPNVLRSELPISLPGLGHVNCYMLTDGDGVAVVDPGLPGDESWRALVHRLGAAGYKVGDVHSIVITHSHYDHFGGAARLAEESGARIVAHPALHRAGRDIDDDAEFIEFDGDAPDPSPDSPWVRRTPWGTWSQPPEAVIRHFESLGYHGWVDAPAPDVGLADRAEVMLAERPWVAVHTPGHTADHLCLYDAEAGLMITGDHVLPTITPHISAFASGSDPLALFMDSLNRMHDFADVRLALPAHGDPFIDLAGRAGTICDHHDDRLDRFREVADQVGVAPVETYMQHAFRERSWGDMASSETYAHLDHLRNSGHLTATWVDGHLHFGPTP